MRGFIGADRVHNIILGETTTPMHFRNEHVADLLVEDAGEHVDCIEVDQDVMLAKFDVRSVEWFGMWNIHSRICCYDHYN